VETISSMMSTAAASISTGNSDEILLVESSRAGGAKKYATKQQQKDITILDRFNDAAVVKIVASTWVDDLEEVKFEGQWKIINVLWELKPDLPKPSAK
jgi:hypothetical protein